MVPFSRQFQTFTFILSYAYWVIIYNDLSPHYPHNFKYAFFIGYNIFRVYKFFHTICRLQNIIFLTIIIIISKNKNNFTDVFSVKVFHNGLIQQPERLYLGSLQSFCILSYCSCLSCLTLYSGRAQKHLSGPSDTSTFFSVIPHLLHWKGANQT